MAVVKANAYGHGPVPVASTAVNGASLLAVGSLDEGIELRQAGIKAPILVLGSVPAEAFEEAVQRNLATSIYDPEAIHTLARAAWKFKRKAHIHIRVDTGMGDLGLLPQEVVPLVRGLIRLDGLVLDGLYTDFAAADTLLEVAATQEQLQRFQAVYDSLRATGLSIPYVHAANSAATLTMAASYFNLVRPGMALYGLHPSLDVSVPTGFRRVLTWKSRVVQVRTVPENWSVVSTAVPRSAIKIAVIPVGFAHGFRGSPRNWGEVLINGRRAAILGRVKMDHTVVYASHLPDVQVNDEVVLIGRQGLEEITAEDVARRLIRRIMKSAGISQTPRLAGRLDEDNCIDCP
jgi:alanine racemase